MPVRGQQYWKDGVQGGRKQGAATDNFMVSLEISLVAFVVVVIVAVVFIVVISIMAVLVMVVFAVVDVVGLIITKIHHLRK